MKLKKLLVLILVAALLVILNFMKKIEGDKERRAADAEALQTVRLVETEASVASVDRLLLQSGADEAKRVVIVKNTEGGWRIESRYNVRADRGQVEGLIQKASAAKGEVRPSSKDVIGDFSLKEDQAFHVALQARDGADIARLLVSPIRPLQSRNFVRLAGSDRVLVTDSDLLSSIGIYMQGAPLEYKTFADLRVVPADVSKLGRIQVIPRAGASFALVKQEGSDPVVWKTDPDGGSEVETAKVNDFLSGLTSLFARDVLDPQAADHGLDEKSPWLVLTETKDGKTTEYRVLRGKRSLETKTAVLKSLPDGLVYEVNDDTLEKLLKRDKASFLKAAS